MRGKPQAQPDFLTVGNLNARVPAGHPLRAIKHNVDGVLKKLSPLFDQLWPCPDLVDRWWVSPLVAALGFTRIRSGRYRDPVKTGWACSSPLGRPSPTRKIVRMS